MRWFFLVAAFGWLGFLGSAFAEDAPESEAWERAGYGASEPVLQYDVAHDGYGGVGRPTETGEAPTYVVVEADTGTETEYEGEPILVVKEPEPVAATSVPPPAPLVVQSDEVVLECPSGVWVHGYWDYRGGRYVWVEGHCVAVRVNYVFVAPRWDFYWDIWWFIPGYYRPCGVWVTYGYYRPWYWFPPYPYPYYDTGRAVPVRRTTTRPATTTRAPTATPVPRHPTTVIQTAPSGRTRPISLGRAGTGPVVTDKGVRTRHGADIVTEPQKPTPAVTGFGTTGTSYPRGFSRGRARTRPSTGGSGWTPSSSSGSSKGWGGSRTRSTPSGRSGSSGGSRGGGFGGKRK